MCYPTDYTYAELRALLSDAIATAKCTRGSLDDALHAMFEPTSLTPAVDPPIDDHSPVAAGASDPHDGEHHQ